MEGVCTSLAGTDRRRPVRRFPPNRRTARPSAFRRRPTARRSSKGWFWRVTEPSTGRARSSRCAVSHRHPEGHRLDHRRRAASGCTIVGREAAPRSTKRWPATSAVQRGAAGSASVQLLRGVSRRRRLPTRRRASQDSESSEPRPPAQGVLRWLAACSRSIPFLNQYRHPDRLGGRATGSVEFEGQRWDFTDATLYAERNWGAGFPHAMPGGVSAHDFDGADRRRRLRRARSNSGHRIGRPREWWCGWAERSFG